MTLASPQPNPDQLSYLDAEMKMTNAHVGAVGWLSGEQAARTRAEAQTWTSLHSSVTEGPASDQPLPMKNRAVVTSHLNRFPMGQVIPAQWLLERVQS